MIKFLDWIKLNESLQTVITDPLDDIEINQSRSGTEEFIFTHLGERYRVYFSKGSPSGVLNIRNNSVPLTGVTVEIGFTGPKGYDLTGSAGVQSNAIYKKMLLGIRKYLSTNHIDAISFSAYDENTLPIYNMFYKKFLQPDPPQGAGFIRYLRNFYLSKDWIRKNRDKIDDGLFEKIIDASRSIRSDIRYIKQSKSNLKKQIQLQNSFKKFYRIKANGKLGYGYDSDSVGEISLIYSNENNVLFGYFDLNDLEPVVVPNMAEENSLLTAIKDSVVYNNFIPHEVWQSHGFTGI